MLNERILAICEHSEYSNQILQICECPCTDADTANTANTVKHTNAANTAKHMNAANTAKHI
jgi:hypothetical protein